MKCSSDLINNYKRKLQEKQDIVFKVISEFTLEQNASLMTQVNYFLYLIP